MEEENLEELHKRCIENEKMSVKLMCSVGACLDMPGAVLSSRCAPVCGVPGC